jgi:hypothetical protein
MRTPPAAGTDVPDNGLDPMVTMVLVRGGRAAPTIKAAISVNSAAGAGVRACLGCRRRQGHYRCAPPACPERRRRARARQGCRHGALKGARLPTAPPAPALPPLPA